MDSFGLSSLPFGLMSLLRMVRRGVGVGGEGGGSRGEHGGRGGRGGGGGGEGGRRGGRRGGQRLLVVAALALLGELVVAILRLQLVVGVVPRGVGGLARLLGDAGGGGGGGGGGGRERGGEGGALLPQSLDSRQHRASGDVQQRVVARLAGVVLAERAQRPPPEHERGELRHFDGRG